MAALIYSLCALTSILCCVLLWRSWRASRARLLFWSALCFVFLAANNLFVVFDLVIFPNIDFLAARYLSSLAAISVLLWGFIWETD
jgi:Family of unknown function (DUF5985)